MIILKILGFIPLIFFLILLGMCIYDLLTAEEFDEDDYYGRLK